MKKFTAIILTVISIIFAMTISGCNSDDETISTVSADASAQLSAEQLKSEIIGQWGRQGEVMHYFNSDMTCIIGGMQGTYDIDTANSLVLTTMGGTVTTYEWAQSSADAHSKNYWKLSESEITINGNMFTKIAGEETADQP